MNKDQHLASAAKKDSSLRRLASLASLSLAVILVVVKLVAWVLTGSVALLSSAIDALVDTAASLATFFGVRYAERPADEDHRFGHGKGEAIAGFTQAAFLAGAALVLAFQSIERLFFPACPTIGDRPCRHHRWHGGGLRPGRAPDMGCPADWVHRHCGGPRALPDRRCGEYRRAPGARNHPLHRRGTR